MLYNINVQFEISFKEIDNREIVFVIFMEYILTIKKKKKKHVVDTFCLRNR